MYYLMHYDRIPAIIQGNYMSNSVGLISNSVTSTNSDTLNTNYWHEQFLDVKYPLIKSAKDVLFSPIKRPLSVLAQLAISINPTIAFNALNSKYQLRRISLDLIERNAVYNNVPAGVTIPSNERLKYLLTRIDALAKKMGVTKPLEIYTSNEQIATGCVGGITAKPAYILVDLQMMHLPDDQLDAVICHELTHLKDHHTFKGFLFSATVLVIDALAMIFLSPLAFLGVEAVASFTDRLFHQYLEQSCDNQAMQILGTGKGIGDFFESTAKKAKDLKGITDFDAFVKKIDPRRVRKLKRKGTLNIDKMHEAQARITPTGNNRKDFHHPLLTSRAETGRQFLPTSV